MKKVMFTAVLIAALGGSLSAADLVNKDNQVHEVTAVYGTGVYGGNENPVPVTFRMVPGFEYKYICGACTIKMNGSTVQVTESDVVVIQGGKLVKQQ